MILNLAATIRQRRHQLGLTLQQVADRAGCTKGYLSTIENDRRSSVPSKDLLERLERALQMPAGTLVLAGGWQATPSEVREQVRSLEEHGRLAKRLAELLKRDGVDEVFRRGELGRIVDTLSMGAGARPGGAGAIADGGGGGRAANGNGGASRGASYAAPGGARLLGVLPMQVPVINKVAAGYPTEFTDLSYPARVADDYVSVPDVADTDAFGARVCGDSMMPVYREGDIVVFSPEAPTAEGSDCFVRFERNSETTFKRVYFEQREGGEFIRLQPLNPAYPAKTVHREEVAGMYAAVYVVRPVGRGGGGA